MAERLQHAEQDATILPVPSTGVRLAAGAMRMDVAGLSDTGRIRTGNEDHFVIASVRASVEIEQTNLPDPTVFRSRRHPSAHLFVIADGVGGQAGGRVASGMTVQTIVEYLDEFVGCFQRMDVDGEQEFLEHLTGAVKRAHGRLQEEFGDKGGPATTLTMVALLWPRAYFVHVGDSRAYLLRAGRLRQLTQDQTMGDLMVDIGRMREDEARKGGLYNVLASSVGGDLSPSIGLVDLEADDALLLCTDGLTKHVGELRIGHVVATAPDSAAGCRALVGEALEGGGTDNVTVIVARFART